MDDLVPTIDEPTSIDVTLLVKAKHADLWAAAKKLGGQSALARELGICVTSLARWMNLHGFPSPETISRIEPKLLALTSKTADELFPEPLRKTDLLDGAKSIELHTQYVENHGIRLTDQSLSPDAREIIVKVLKTLTYREREIAKLRYGLNDGHSYSLEEVGAIFKCS